MKGFGAPPPVDFEIAVERQNLPHTKLPSGVNQASVGEIGGNVVVFSV